MKPSPDETDIRVPVELGPRSYEVRVVTGRSSEFGPFARSVLDTTWAGQSCKSAFIVTDNNLIEPSRAWGYRDALAKVGIDAPHTGRTRRRRKQVPGGC